LLAGGTLYLEAVSRVDMSALAPAPGPLVLDREGRILRLVPGSQDLRTVKLPAGELPRLLVSAFIAAEDQRFWQHPGVDLPAVARAAGQNLAAGRIVSGASTLTMQLARLTYPGPRTYGRKTVEMFRSLRIEAALTKKNILRAYLNRVPLGGNLVGVETAALSYFGKPAAELSAAEAALMAALPKAPTALRPLGPRHQRLLARQRWVLGRMAHLGYLSSQEHKAALQEPLLFQGPGRGAPIFPFRAPHFVQLVLQENQPAEPAERLVTTLDLALQDRVEAVVRSHRVRLLRSGASQAAAVVVDNRTREVLALAGSFRYGPRDQGFNNGAVAPCSPGSALKPFLYALALDQGFPSGSVLEDVERRYRTPRGEFIPANYDRSTHGPVSFREALGNSLNLSAVHLLNQVGPQVYYDTLMKLDLINHPERGPEHYGLGLVVGNPEVTLLQLAAAYATLANQGLYRPLRLQPAAPTGPGEQVFSPQAAYIVSDILADPLARGRFFGGSQATNPLHGLALKTGTSTRYRDCWCVGYTPEFTIAVWVGNFSGRPTAGLSGSTAAAPMVIDLARVVCAASPPGEFPRPEGIVRRTICTFSGLIPGPGCVHQRQEIFVIGSEPTRTCTYHRPRDPWHRMPTPYADWLQKRHHKGGEGRFRLAGFPMDLARVFPDRAPVSQIRAGPPAHSGKVTLGLPDDRGGRVRISPPAPEQAPTVTIAYPLSGDRFLVPPGADSLRLTARAACQRPFSSLTWFVNGREEAATGPPYELTLELARGRHQLTVVGPDGLGEVVEVGVE